MISNPVSADAVRQTKGDFYDAFRQLDQTGEFATSISLLEGLLLVGSSYTHRWKSHLSYGRFVASTGPSPQ
jgi:hypothetical protein